MRVNQHAKLQGLAGPSEPGRAAESRLARDRLALSGADALNRALQQTPALRAEAVARAKRQLESSDYPSPVLTAQVASLLARFLGSRDGRI